MMSSSSEATGCPTSGAGSHGAVEGLSLYESSAQTPRDTITEYIDLANQNFLPTSLFIPGFLSGVDNQHRRFQVSSRRTRRFPSLAPRHDADLPPILGKRYSREPLLQETFTLSEAPPETFPPPLLEPMTRSGLRTATRPEGSQRVHHEDSECISEDATLCEPLPRFSRCRYPVSAANMPMNVVRPSPLRHLPLL